MLKIYYGGHRELLEGTETRCWGRLRLPQRRRVRRERQERETRSAADTLILWRKPSGDMSASDRIVAIFNFLLFLV